jgi:hypothetical protein
MPLLKDHQVSSPRPMIVIIAIIATHGERMPLASTPPSALVHWQSAGRNLWNCSRPDFLWVKKRKIHVSQHCQF